MIALNNQADVLRRLLEVQRLCPEMRLGQVLATIGMQGEVVTRPRPLGDRRRRPIRRRRAVRERPPASELSHESRVVVVCFGCASVRLLPIKQDEIMSTATVELPDDLDARLDSVAALSGTAKAELVREALETFLAAVPISEQQTPPAEPVSASRRGGEDLCRQVRGAGGPLVQPGTSWKGLVKTDGARWCWRPGHPWRCMERRDRYHTLGGLQQLA